MVRVDIRGGVVSGVEVGVVVVLRAFDSDFGRAFGLDCLVLSSTTFSSWCSVVLLGLGLSSSSISSLKCSFFGSVANSLNAFSSPSKSKNSLQAGPGWPSVPFWAFWFTKMGSGGL